MLKIALPLLFVLFAVLVMRRLLRYRRRARLVINQRSRETRESLWSWRLLWTQVKALLLLLLKPFLRRRRPRGKAQAAPDDLPAAPSARTLREIYRLLLRRAAVLAAVLGFGLTLGGSSKSDVPAWPPHRGAGGPKSSHDGPAAR